jgi:hypothetical protein
MKGDKLKNVIKDFISRKDPQGYYVIPAKKEALEILRETDDINIEEGGDYIIIRTKSRREAERILKALAKRGLLELEL